MYIVQSNKESALSSTSERKIIKHSIIGLSPAVTVQVSQVNVWKSYYIAALTLKQYNETIVWNRESWADGGYSYTPDTSISLLFTTKRSYVASAMAKVTRNP